MIAIAPEPGAPGVVLASASLARRVMLANAGVEFSVEPALVDEDEIKRTMKAAGETPDLAAEALAETKATRVSLKRRGVLVIGADQMLECNGVWFDKPPDRAHAAAQLRAMAGRTHRLISAVAVARDGVGIWRHTAQVRMTMRSLSPEFIERYLDALGDAALQSVGAYQLEGLGAQLFLRVEGDYFTVLGLPLLPLLGFLREHGVVPA
jgi:septum formation protein